MQAISNAGSIQTESNINLLPEQIKESSFNNFRLAANNFFTIRTLLTGVRSVYVCYSDRRWVSSLQAEQSFLYFSPSLLFIKIAYFTINGV